MKPNRYFELIPPPPLKKRKEKIIRLRVRNIINIVQRLKKKKIIMLKFPRLSKEPATLEINSQAKNKVFVRREFA